MQDMGTMGMIFHRVPFLPFPDRGSADVVLLGKSPFRKVGLPDFLSDRRRCACPFMEIDLHMGPFVVVTYRASLGDRFFPDRLRASACQKRTGTIMALTPLGASSSFHVNIQQCPDRELHIKEVPKMIAIEVIFLLTKKG